MSHSHSSWPDLPPVPLPQHNPSLHYFPHSDEQQLDPRTGRTIWSIGHTKSSYTLTEKECRQAQDRTDGYEPGTLSTRTRTTNNCDDQVERLAEPVPGRVCPKAHDTMQQSGLRGRVTRASKTRTGRTESVVQSNVFWLEAKSLGSVLDESSRKSLSSGEVGGKMLQQLQIGNASWATLPVSTVTPWVELSAVTFLATLASSLLDFLCCWCTVGFSTCTLFFFAALLACHILNTFWHSSLAGSPLATWQEARKHSSLSFFHLWCEQSHRS